MRHPGDICMHYGDDLIRGSQTAGSLIAHLRPDGTATCWLTGTSAPCLGLFKPFYLDSGSAGGCKDVAAALGPEPDARYDPAALWWQGERLHRTVLADYSARSAVFLRERDALEAAFLADEALRRTSPDMAASAAATAPNAFSARCIARGRAALDQWIARVEATPVTRRAPWLYRRRWDKQNRSAGVSV